MSEQVPYNPEENPEPPEGKQAIDKLADEAVSAFSKHDFQALDRALLKLGQEVGVELETELDEVLQENQKTYDFLFGEGAYNLKAEYLQGRVKTFGEEQKKELEKSPYSEIIVIPGQISRKELIQIVNQKYKEEFGKFLKKFIVC